MSRPGAGGGGGHSFGGGHSMGHSGGGHSMGGGTRSGGSRSGGSRPSGGGSFRPGGGFGSGGSFGTGGAFGHGNSYNNRRRRQDNYGGGYMGGPVVGGGYNRRGTNVNRRGGGIGGCGTAVAIFVIAMIALIILASVLGSAGSSNTAVNQKSTINRTKIETSQAFMNDCVKDELDWIRNENKTASGLKNFWEETGVQPYVYLKDYDASLQTDEEKEQWTIDYYDSHFDQENVFLYVYFAEEDENEVGYMCYANGAETSKVMDSEAVEIFWNNMDYYWYAWDADDTDTMFVKVFDDTAETIMATPTNAFDVLKWGVGAVAVVAAGVTVVTLVKQKHKRDKEKAEEDQQILNTPIDDLIGDDLENKYLDKEESEVQDDTNIDEELAGQGWKAGN